MSVSKSKCWHSKFKQLFTFIKHVVSLGPLLVIIIRVTSLGNFFPIGLLLEAHYDLKKDKVAPQNGDILGYFLL